MSKIERTDQFKHMVWRRHPDAGWLDECRPELVASNGNRVRRLSSQQGYIAFQVFDDSRSGREIVEKVEASVSRGVGLMGYSMFSSHPAVAILHTSEGLKPGWVAYPHQRAEPSAVPTLPLHVANMPQLRLVGGADVKWVSGSMVMDCLLEQRGDRFAKSEHGFNITAHICDWEMRGQVGRGENRRALRLARRGADSVIRRTSETQLAARFQLDELAWNEYQNDDSLEVWFIISFDRELMCLPEDWLRFPVRIEFTR